MTLTNSTVDVEQWGIFELALHGSAAGNFTMGGTLATIGSAIVVGVAAMATAASVGVQRETSRAGSPSLLAQRTHLSAGGTASSGGSSLAGPGSAANGPP